MNPIWGALWPLFTSTNGISIVIIMIAVLTFIALMTRRMNAQNDGSCVYLNRPHLEAQKMVLIKNPFVFKITKESLKCSHYCDGIECLLSCDNSFWLIHYWAVNIIALHEYLSTDWRTMRNAILDGLFLNNNFLLKSEPDLFHEVNEELTHSIKPPGEISDDEIGETPRRRYPLVIIMARNDDDDGVELADTDIVCLITVIHIKDSICKMDTGIIAQFLKQRSGQVFNLQQLYSPDPASDPRNDGENARICVVCRCSPISRAILPCRHACVCGSCFERLDDCPLCRGSILSFFKISEEVPNTEDHHEDIEEQNQPVSQSSWFSRFNDKLNQWLGMN